MRVLNEMLLGTDYQIYRDILNPDSPTFLFLTRYTDRSILHRMTFNSLLSDLNWRENSTDWATRKEFARRFCPACLEDDRVPHFRLAWRIVFAPICLEHRIALLSECRCCRTKVMFNRNNPYYDVGRCRRCGHSLSDCVYSRLEIDESVLEDVSGLVELATRGRMSAELGRKYSTVDLYEALHFVTGFLKLIKLSRKGMHYVNRLPLKSIDDEYEVCELTSRAYRLLSQIAELEDLVRKNQTLFNSLAHGYSLPPALAILRRPEHKRVNWSCVFNAIRELERKKQPVTRRAISLETGLSLKNLSHIWNKYGSLMHEINNKIAKKTMQDKMSSVESAIASAEAKSMYPAFEIIKRISRVDVYQEKTLLRRVRRAQVDYENKIIPRIEEFINTVALKQNYSYKYIAHKLGLSGHGLSYSGKIRRVVRKSRSVHEDRVLANLIEVIGSKQVSEPLTFSELGKKIGIQYHKIIADQRLRRVIQSARNKSQKFYYSKLIENESCKDHLEYYKSYAKKLVINLGLMDHNYSDLVSTRCSICKRQYYIDVSSAPLQRHFPPISPIHPESSSNRC